MRSGLVLAGGRSVRFGETDKALADVDGTSMVRRVADRLAGVVDEVIVNCRPAQRDELAAALDGRRVRFAVDPVPDEGPVAGVRTGLRVARGSAVAVAGCDMPAVSPALFDRLFDAAGAAAVPRADGRLHPLHAVYDRNAARVGAERTLATGSRRLYDFLDRVDPAVVDAESVPDVDASAFVDVDTRGELTAAAEVIGG